MLRDEEICEVNLDCLSRLWSARAASLWVCVAVALCAGCGMDVSTPEEFAAFEKAGPVLPEVDSTKIVAARRYAGAYRVVAGDLLEFHMPAVMRAAMAKRPGESYRRLEPYLTRINPAGEISLPMVGQFTVADKTLGQIEQIIAKAYHPKYVVMRPSVVVRVAEYRTATVAIVGGVEKPGVYQLRSNEMSLVALLMNAGGFASEGASIIRIRRPGKPDADPVLLPVKDMNIPFQDMGLTGGETVEVQQMAPRIFTVIGLVNKPGAFTYPANVEYTLLEAMGFAGGVDGVADPRYASVYRRGADGKIVSVVFQFNDKKLTRGARMRIRPGDVVSVEQTGRTKTRQMLASVFRVVFGAQVVARYDTGLGSAD